MYRKKVYLDQKGIERLKKVYRTYATETIEIAIKKPLNLLEAVEKSVRSSVSQPPKLPRIASDHIGREENNIERKKLNINILLIRNEIRKVVVANNKDPFNPILNSSFKLFGKLLFPSKCFLQLSTSDSDKRKQFVSGIRFFL